LAASKTARRNPLLRNLHMPLRAVFWPSHQPGVAGGAPDRDRRTAHAVHQLVVVEPMPTD
jgi:hypothetical protein